MFPLGTVMLPGTAVPLHVFEPRYRQLVDDCQAADGMFGVVLIERGSEVGGGDVRTDVGTLTRIVEAQALPDGRWFLGVAGIERIRVQQWLPDDPYPRAELVTWPDELGEGDSAGSGSRDGTTRLLRRVAALRAELGRPAPPVQFELPDEPVWASYAAVAVSPLGPADRQQLLAAPTVDDRWQQLGRLLADHARDLEAQLAG